MGVHLVRILRCDPCGDSEYIPYRTPKRAFELRLMAQESGWKREFVPASPGTSPHWQDVCPQCVASGVGGAGKDQP